MMSVIDLKYRAALPLWEGGHCSWSWDGRSGGRDIATQILVRYIHHPFRHHKSIIYNRDAREISISGEGYSVSLSGFDRDGRLYAVHYIR